jgi:hypothetical protein
MWLISFLAALDWGGMEQGELQLPPLQHMFGILETY